MRVAESASPPFSLEILELEHRFPDGSYGLRGASLEVAAEDFLIVAGRNGSGKTLLMRHVIGLLQPSAGRILVSGRALEDDVHEARRRIGLIFQDAEAQVLGQTVEEDVAFGPACAGLSTQEIRRRSAEAIGLMGLEGLEKRAPESLSGGELRRLAIASILAMQPDCLILDEPFANLDYPAIRTVLHSLVSLHSMGTTIVVLTHELEKVLAHATRLAIMERGAFVYDGQPKPQDRSVFGRHGLADPFRHGLSLGHLTWLD